MKWWLGITCVKYLGFAVHDAKKKYLTSKLIHISVQSHYVKSDKTLGGWFTFTRCPTTAYLVYSQFYILLYLLMYCYPKTSSVNLPLGTHHSWKITTLAHDNTCKRGKNEYPKTMKAKEFSGAAGRNGLICMIITMARASDQIRRGLNNRSQWGCHCLLFWCVHCDEAENVPCSLTYRLLLIYSSVAHLPCHPPHMTRFGKRKERG